MISKPIGFILLATLSFAVMNTMAKELSALPVMEVVFFRVLGTLVFIFPYMLLKKIPMLGQHRKMLLLRSVVGVISLGTFFLAIQRIPLGSAISIRYLGPIFGAVLAYFFLHEKINKWQWVSFIVAFAGVLVHKGFDLRIDHFSLFLALTSAFFLGMVFVLLRYLGSREHHLTIINYFMVVSLVVSLFFSFDWRIPLVTEWPSVISIGIFGLLGQILMTRAFQMAETSVLAPFKYMELVYALILGFLFFEETYSWLPFLGIVLIMAGMLMSVWAKRQKKVGV